MKPTEYHTIHKCRLCGSGDLTQLLSLGSQYVSDFIEDPAKYKNIKVPITLCLCRQCSLVQLQDSATPDFLYTRHYWYRSGVTDTMRKALKNITEHAEFLVELNTGDVVCDIGSNDGTLLRSYSADVYRVGVEPANNMVQQGSIGVDAFIHDFWSAKAYNSRVGVRAKIITAIGMFYDLEDPHQFIADVAACLSKNGVFIAQLMCLRNMLNINDLGNLAHEHLEFYSLRSLNYLFKSNGLELIDIFKNDVNGESYRLVVRMIGGSIQPSVGAKDRLSEAMDAEKGLDTPEFYNKFFEEMEENKESVVSFIKDVVKNKGKIVWVYGASTKGNVILQYYGLDHTLIAAAADKSPEKYGRYTVGTNIPIVSEEEARKANPDYFLVLPYAFMDEFTKREEEWLKNGGVFIVPLPKLKWVVWNG